MKRILFIILTLVSLLFGQFSVEQFSGGSAYPQAGTSILLPHSGTYLTELSQITDDPTLRRRFSAMEYRLYTGKFNESAFSSRSNVQRFIRPSNLSIQSFNRMKFFDSQRINSVGDLQDCYFHGDTLFVVGFVRLFYNESGSWKTIEALGQSRKKTTGDIAIRSNPAGALIILNGDTTGVTTPNYITDLPEGRCQIRVVQNDCVPCDTTVQVVAGKIVQVNFDLSSRYGSVVFDGFPRGAKVKLNGVTVGTIPCKIENLIPHEYTFAVEDPFYQTKRVPVNVGSGKVVPVSVRLAESFGVITLPDMPGNRWWTINGEPVASGSLRFNHGTHRVFWDGGEQFRSIDTIIQLGLGDTVSVIAEKEIRTGGIKVLPLPMSCALYVDGSYRGEAPIIVDGLVTGNHTIELVRSGYDRVVQIVQVEGESVAEIRCELHRTGANEPIATSKSKSSGELAFISMNGQAKVYQGDSLVAITGKGSVKIPAGKYEFRFESATDSQTKTVTVASGERKAVLVSFLDQ